MGTGSFSRFFRITEEKLCLRPKVQAALLVLVFYAFPAYGADKTKGLNGLFTWDLLWTGSWYKVIETQNEELQPHERFLSGGTLYNRGGVTLGMPGQNLALRFLVTDKRLLPPEDEDGKAGFNPAVGFYHTGSGSRFLYGVQSEYGLPARINHIWQRSVPFMEARQPSSRDLKTEPSAQDESDAYLYLALPRNFLPSLSASASAVLDSEQNPAFGGGLGFSRNGKDFLLDGFFAKKGLPPRNASTWFSTAPPLPERDFSIYALGAIFNSPLAALAADLAFSETYAWGRGAYGNFSLRLGQKPWRFSLAGDGAGGRFADRSGSTTGAGFRVAAKGERFWPRSGLLRFQGTLRSPGFEDGFNRGSFSAYYRPSAPTAAAKRSKPALIRFTRSSFSLSRDARNPEKTADALNSYAGFNFGPLSTVFSCSLHSLSCIEENAKNLFALPAFETFDSFKVSGELGWKPSIKRFGAFDLRSRLGYTTRAKKDPLWDFSFNCSVKPGRWGRVGVKIASPDFPEKWNYTLSWRFETRLP